MTKLFLLFQIFFLSILPLNSKKNEDIDLNIHGNYYVLMEPVSKSIIACKNENERLYPASMTKMMGLLLCMEELEKKNISWDDMVTCSSFASSMGGTQIYLEEGEKISLKDLVKSIAINSANDAIVCLGEYIYSSIDVFVKKMNEKAKKLNMINTHFMNATGFDDDNHYSSCLDMAILGSELLKYEEEIIPFTSMKEGYVREDSSSPFWLVNTNKLLGNYEGMDGLKTGYTNKAKYNITATAKRKNVRLVSCVMKEDSIENRSKDTIRLLNYGFANIEQKVIYQKGEVIAEVEINDNFVSKTKVTCNKDLVVYINKDENINDIKVQLIIDEISLPLDKNKSIGNIIITTASSRKYTYLVFPCVNVDKPSFFDYVIKNLKLIFF